MTLEFYKVLHLAGLIFLFTGIGGFLALSEGNRKRASFAMYLHGVGLMLLLISGFGMVAKSGVGFPWWVITKIVLWLVLGAMLAFAKRNVFPVRTLIIISILIGCVLAYLGLTWKTEFRIMG